VDKALALANRLVPGKRGPLAIPKASLATVPVGVSTVQSLAASGATVFAEFGSEFLVFATEKGGSGWASSMWRRLWSSPNKTWLAKLGWPHGLSPGDHEGERYVPGGFLAVQTERGVVIRPRDLRLSRANPPVGSPAGGGRRRVEVYAPGGTVPDTVISTIKDMERTLPPGEQIDVRVYRTVTAVSATVHEPGVSDGPGLAGD
jgi:hypothetical protein